MSGWSLLSLQGLPVAVETDGDDGVRLALEARKGPPASLLGMVALIASEATLFGAFIATYFYLRIHNVYWPPPGTPEPKWIVPSILVAILALTSIPVQLSWRCVRAGRVAPARLLLASAFVVQLGYFAYEVHDFTSQLHETEITRNAYTSIYYILLGADHAHVFVGLLLSLWLLAKLAGGLTLYRANASQAITWYWHFVNAMTVVVLLVLLSVHIG
jgi:heme/copper-type cytochrome/quinol oxidase subunit 3